MAVDRWSPIGRLKTAVKKIKILVDLTLNRWKLASLVGILQRKKRRLSFNNDRAHGLAAFLGTESESEEEPGSAGELHRTISYPSEDDVDKRAEAFIANFYKQLRLERQVSLELKYLRGNSFDS
ncbi:hypothetical protein M569_00865, partial [Genlisea aurea]